MNNEEDKRKNKKTLKIRRSQILYVVSIEGKISYDALEQLCCNNDFLIIIIKNSRFYRYDRDTNVIETNSYSEAKNFLMEALENGKIPVIGIERYEEHEIQLKQFEESISNIKKLVIISDQELIERTVVIV